MSSSRDLWKRNIPANRRRATSTTKAAPRPSPGHRRRIRPVARPNSPRLSGSLKRSKSEPSLWTPSGGEEPEPPVEHVDEDEGVLYRPRTCTDIFASSDNLLSEIPGKCPEGYNKDAKVVVNVTVEGSPGPIRTLIKLGTNIEETIKVVVDKYNEEGRTPRLDKDALSSCQLHYSSFSLDSLSKLDLIGDVGTRSFYLRKNDSVGSNGSSVSDMTTPCSSNKDITQVTSSSNNQLTAEPAPFFQIFIQQHIKKIIRRTRKIWRFFGCITCSV